MRLIAIRKADELGVKSRATLVIRVGGRIVEKPLRDVDAVLVIGSRVKISSALPPVLSQHNIPLTVIAKDNVAILMNPVQVRYNNYRRLQYQLDKTNALLIAAEYIRARIAGTANILKYYRIQPPPLAEPPPPIDDPDEYELRIRLWESTSSATLWPALIKLIREDHLETLRREYGFSGRKPRHPDPFNKTLSVMYAVLYSLATKALLAAGLDPTYGFLHRTRYSTPLTFDYTEMLKPIAIQATIELINREGLPELAEDGELTRESVNRAIGALYKYLTMKHKHTGKTPYQYIFLKAYCLAKHLEGKCSRARLTITWNRSEYKEH